MNSRLLNEQRGVRTFVLVFYHGDSVMGPLLEFLKAHCIGAARLSGIGALESVALGYFDWQSKSYERHEIDEQVELLSLAGDVALKDDEPVVHAHVVSRARCESSIVCGSAGAAWRSRAQHGHLQPWSAGSQPG
jgi:uncharacterized protein